MTYSPELTAKIRRLHFHEHYTINAVSQVVSLHRDTVRRILYGDDSPESPERRPRITDQFLSVIEEHLEQYPSIRSTALLRILKDRGYCGSYQSLRRTVMPIKKRVRKSFRPMEVFKGEQGQVDWAHFGSIDVRCGRRKIYLFVMVLSWSRTMFARFTFDQKTDSFLRMHEEAFRYFGGCPRKILYDNLKSAVLERFRDKIRYNPQLLEFSGHYGFEPKACKPYAGNQKGRVERSIRYVRDNFASGYTISTLPQANEDLELWLNEVANCRQWTDNKLQTIQEVWDEEKKFLIPLRGPQISPRFSAELRSDKCSLVRFDLNDYSIPWEYTREIISLEADDFKVFFSHQGLKIAEHDRSWSRGERITNPNHWQEKERNGLNNSDELLNKFPDLDAFFRILIDRGESLRTIKKQMTEIYQLYGESVFLTALQKSKEQDKYHPSQIAGIAVELGANHTKIPVQFGKRKDLAEFEVSSHSLDTYDNL